MVQYNAVSVKLPSYHLTLYEDSQLRFDFG